MSGLFPEMYSEAKLGLKAPNKFFAIRSFEIQSQLSWSQFLLHPIPAAQRFFSGPKWAP